MMSRVAVSFAVLGWLATASVAHAVPPSALVSQGSDGTVNLVIRPERDWTSAELVIVGGDTIDLGPARRGQSIEVEGWAEQKTSHQVVLRIAEEGGRGVTWRFEVDTQVVPERPPFFERGAPREWKKWLFGPKPPPRDPQP